MLLRPARRFLQPLLLVVPPLFVLVGDLETVVAIGGAGQASPSRDVAAVAGRTLPLRHHTTDGALPGTGHDHVRHIQQLRREDPVIQLELATEPVLF